MRLAMSTKKEILRLKSLGHNKNEVAKKLNIQWRTVDSHWEETIQQKPLAPSWTENIDWDDLVKQIEDKTKATLIYEELCAEFSLPSYSTFMRHISKVKKKKEPSIIIRLPKTPGKEIEVDYSGNSISIISPSSGEIISTELFVACLPFSSYVYAEFTFTQKSEDFISSHNRMFNDLGGVPLFVIPDNAKVAVDKYHRYDPKLNLNYHQMAMHYGIGVSPARVRKPKDKASVERAVGLIQEQFFYKVRNKTFTSIHELNCELRKWLNEFNDKKMKGRGVSRNDLLQDERKLFLKSPDKPYEFAHWKSVKIHPDCHFTFDKNHYSVPSQYVGKEVMIKHSENTLKVYLGTEKLCSHTLLKGHGHYQTNPMHYPEEKIAHYNYSIKKAIKESELLGEHVSLLVKKLIDKGVHPLANLRKIQGILGLKNKYSKEALDYGCEMALEANKLFYQYVNNCSKSFGYIKTTTDSLLPSRDSRFICLQGGFDNDGITKTLIKS